MAFADHVQSAGKDAGSVVSSTLAFGVNVTAGNTIVVTVRRSTATVGTVTVTDNVNAGNYVQDANVETADPHGLYIFRKANVSAGATTVTVTFNAARGMRFAIAEYQGDFVVDPTPPTATGTSTAPNSGSATTTASDCIVGAISDGGGSGAITPGAGWTTRQSVAVPVLVTLFDRNGAQASGSYSLSATFATSDTWGAIMVAYKASGGGGGSPAPPPETLPRRRVGVVVSKRGRGTQTTAPATRFIPPTRVRRAVGLFTRRGRNTPYVAIAPSTPVTPQPRTARRVWLNTARSRSTQFVAVVPSPVASQPSRRRVGWLITRRSRWTSVVPVVVVVPPPAYVPNPPRRRVAWTFTRRSRVTATTPPPPVITIPAYVPMALVRRLWKSPRGGRARGAMVAPVASLSQPSYVTPGKPRHVVPGLWRRARVTPTPTPAVAFIAQVPPRHRIPLLSRRSRVTSTRVVPPVIVQPKYVPNGRGRQWRKPLTWLRSRWTPTPVVVVVAPPVVVVQRYDEWFKFDDDEWFVFVKEPQDFAGAGHDEWFEFDVSEFLKFDTDDED